MAWRENLDRIGTLWRMVRGDTRPRPKAFPEPRARSRGFAEGQVTALEPAEFGTRPPPASVVTGEGDANVFETAGPQGHRGRMRARITRCWRCCCFSRSSRATPSRSPRR